MLKKIKIGLLHGINYIKKNLAIRIPCIYLIPKPQAIYLIPSIKCNSKCIMCSFWSKKDVTLSFKQWQKVIDNLYDWCGPYVKINISGGETLLPGVMHQVISYCIKKFPLTGIVSNGFLIDKKEAKKLIQKNFNNINISIDGNTKKTVNMIRGQPFAFKRSRNAIKYLVNEKNRQKKHTKIIVKSVVMGLNIDELVDLTRWAKKTGADGIYFQPIEPIYASNQTLVQLKKTKLWVSNKQKALARKKIDELIKIKTKEGFIINDLDNLKKIKEYFELTQVKKTQKRKHCAIDLTTLFIDPLGKISFCPSYPKLNSLNKYKTQAILYSKNALKQRKIIRNCPKAGNCLSTCVSEKNLLQLIHLFLFLNK